MGLCISYLDRISFRRSPNVLYGFQAIKAQRLNHFLRVIKSRRRVVVVQTLQQRMMITSLWTVNQVRSFFNNYSLLLYSKFLLSLSLLLGDLVLIHGNVLHKSKRNTSARTRFAYTFHMIDSPPYAEYDNKNWLQPTKDMPFSKILSHWYLPVMIKSKKSPSNSHSVIITRSFYPDHILVANQKFPRRI